MKTIVIYKSISGFTEKYAKWIAEELGADIEKQNKASQKILKKYNTIIYGGSLHAVGIIGLKKLRKLLIYWKIKNLLFLQWEHLHIRKKF